jgi:hypothetical protein
MVSGTKGTCFFGPGTSVAGLLIDGILFARALKTIQLCRLDDLF